MLLLPECPMFGRVVRLACATLLMLLAANTKTSASTLHPSAREPLPTASTLASFPASDANEANDIELGARDKESLVGKTTFAINSSSHASTVSAPATEPVVDISPSHTAFEASRTPDWGGVWRDTGILFGAQIAVAGIIYTMPESVSKWSAEDKRNSFDKYVENVGDPVFDKDKFYINYILHPYWGATYYIRARERGLGKGPSFVYSALISAMYEFGIECFFEKPSIQDLISTPIGGSLLGAYIFEPLRESIKRKKELRWYDEAILIATDPIGVLSSGIEKLLGIKPTINIVYSVPQLQKLSTRSAIASNSNRFGVLLQFPLN